MGEQQVKHVDQPLLQLESMMGFCGAVPSGLIIHPDKTHMLYPVGCTVVIENLTNKKQDFLSGHTNNVSCLAVSKSGDYVASGQITHMGFKGDVIIWDFHTRKVKAKLTLHMVKVEALAFSPNDKYLVTLGGEDDGSVVVWRVDTGEAICGSQAQVNSAGMTHTLCYANNSDEIFVTGGNGTLRIWHLEVANRKIRPSEVNMGQLKRIIKCIVVDPQDHYLYCGTTTGDILVINRNSCNFQKQGPKQLFSQGITSMVLLKTGQLIVGTGDGTVAVVEGHEKGLKRTRKIVKLDDNKAGAVTSVALRGEGHQFFVGTDRCSIFRFAFDSMPETPPTLLNTCHYAPINDIAFAYGTGALFLTCSYQDIRVWANTTPGDTYMKGAELLRIVIPNMTCNAVEVSRNGGTIISGWDDGTIRAFYPESGKPMYTIKDAHGGGVTALNLLCEGNRIISGGKEGGVRVWEVKAFPTMQGGMAYKSSLLFALKEHKASVTCIKVRKNDSQCITSSVDGSCIIWDLVNCCRLQMIREKTQFKYVCYHPQEHQIIATGTDRKIGYYECFDASLVRDLDGSKSGSINCMDISGDGHFFVSGGDDKLVKVFRYNDGSEDFIGIGHSAPITCVKISPCESYIISVSCDGAILKWRIPYALNRAA